jgi:hypothetical protein
MDMVPVRTLSIVIVVSIIIGFCISCIPIVPVTVYTPVTIIETTATLPVAIKEEKASLPTLYIKDIKVTQSTENRANFINNTANITFTTTIPAIVNIKTIVFEKEFYSIQVIDPTLNHNIKFGGLRSGATYTAIINAYGNNTEDKATVTFVAAIGTDEVSNQGNSWSGYGYSPPVHYSGSNINPD